MRMGGGAINMNLLLEDMKMLKMALKVIRITWGRGFYDVYEADIDVDFYTNQ